LIKHYAVKLSYKNLHRQTHHWYLDETIFYGSVTSNRAYHAR